jgi:hypothetical protein
MWAVVGKTLKFLKTAFISQGSCVSIQWSVKIFLNGFNITFIHKIHKPGIIQIYTITVQTNACRYIEISLDTQ